MQNLGNQDSDCGSSDAGLVSYEVRGQCEVIGSHRSSIEPAADYKMEYAKSRKSLDSDCGSSDAGLVSYEVRGQCEVVGSHRTSSRLQDGICKI